MVFSEAILTSRTRSLQLLATCCARSCGLPPLRAQGRRCRDTGDQQNHTGRRLVRIGIGAKQRHAQAARIGIICGERRGGLQVRAPRCFPTMTLMIARPRSAATCDRHGPITEQFLRSLLGFNIQHQPRTVTTHHGADVDHTTLFPRTPHPVP